MFKHGSQIEAAFFGAKTAKEALTAVYRIFIPDWKLQRADSYTLFCGNGLYRFVSIQFHIFDYQKNPNQPTGTLWNRYGFVRDEGLTDWEIKITQNDLLEAACSG
ncbi:hypothetical protein [uncultured Desulfosarcina sp.]|uniref:hypothetical protein n=1 Tax=uncultured Desulfosarcina sp. TaxID=218289 RepID=UPI0029C72DA2|nr:hypothetical protein [uncultured Desulfosarcina sp.]